MLKLSEAIWRIQVIFRLAPKIVGLDETNFIPTARLRSLHEVM
jgi:hypothetical protein